MLPRPHPDPKSLGPPHLTVAGLELWVHGRRSPQAHDYWEGNWLDVTVHCAAPGASIWIAGALLRVPDVVRWAEELDRMQTGRAGVATLTSDEPNLTAGSGRRTAPRTRSSSWTLRRITARRNIGSDSKCRARRCPGSCGNAARSSRRIRSETRTARAMHDRQVARRSVAAARLGRQLAHREWHRGLLVAVDRDLEAVGTRVGKGHIEHENCPSFDFRHAGRRLGEVDGAVAAEDLRSRFVEEADLDLVLTHLGALPLEAEHEVQPGMHGGELLHPDVLKNAQHGQFPGLIDQGVVRDDREIEVQAATTAHA